MAVSDTIRGFRTQFLYTIYRVINDCNPDVHYVPEGIEDLDIKKNEIIIETIQIKNYNKKIQPSNLTSPAGTTSFFKRAIKTLSKNKNACIRFVSFGEVGDYLKNSSSLLVFLKKKNKDIVLKKNAELLSSQYKLSNVQESTLYAQISEKLKNKFPTFNPDKEIKYMLQWVSDKAEKHNDFTYEEFFRELHCYQAFENRQNVALDELGIRVKPLFEESLNFDKEVLKQQFYSGVSVSSNHIACNLDIVRTDKLIAIQSAFKESNVVIVNGASGQGKSTLCYRYIKENNALAFEITQCDRFSLPNLQATLTELCTELTIPVMFYFDAKPADDSWIHLVKTFSMVKNVHCLISLRNEDWNQYRSRLGSEIVYKDIELVLAKDEAKLMYEALRNQNNQINCDFESSWDKLGNNVPLLEFVYFITHGQSLKKKLISQWSALSQDEKSIFEKIITVIFFGGRINRKSKILQENRSCSSVHDAIGKYIGEFFVEDINGDLSEVHPIRTKILAESIYRNDSETMIENALSLYFKSEMTDAHLYLLNLYREGLSTSQLISLATKGSILPAKQFAGIVRALIWKGTEEYLSEVLPLINQLKEKSGPLWEYHLPINFTDIDVRQSLSELLKNNPDVPDVSGIVNSFPSQNQIFCLLDKFINNKFTVSCKSNSDWVIFSDALYRISLNHNNTYIDLKGEPELSTLDAADISSILLGLKSLGIKKDWWINFENSFVKKLRLENLITNIEISNKSIKAICNIDYIVSIDTSTNTYIVRIINQLRKAFPEKENYHVKLGKDDLSDFVVDNEKNINKTNLPINAMHEIRACVVNQYKNKIGIPNKKDYISMLISRRKEITTANQRFANAFSTFLKKGKIKPTEIDEAHEQCISSTSKEIPELSYISSNGFGYGTTVSDELGKIISNNGSGKNSSWDAFIKSINDYISNLLRFFLQIRATLLDKNGNKEPSKACLIEALTVVKVMQTKFKEQFLDYITDDRGLKMLDEKEYESVLSLWVIWETQCRHITDVTLNSQMTRYRKLETNIPLKIDSIIQHEFSNEGINCVLNKVNQTLNVVIEFDDIVKYYRAYLLISDILKNVIGKYDTFTSQSYIIRKLYTTISVQYIYIDKSNNRHRVSSVVHNYNVEHLLNSKDISNSFYQEFIPETKGSADIKLSDYEDILGLANSILFVGHQITEMENSVIETDVLGQQIVKSYADKCLTEFNKHKSAICQLKNRLSNLNNIPYHDELYKMINIIENIYVTAHWINLIPELDKIMQTILYNDMEIRLYLIDN